MTATPITFVHEMRPIAMVDDEPLPVAYERAELYTTEAVYLDAGTLRSCVVTCRRSTAERLGMEVARQKLREAALEQIFERTEGVRGEEN
jgi:hypothetical protein